MTGTVADFGTLIPRRIVAFWPLSLAVPQLLSIAIQCAIYALGLEEVVDQSAVLLPFFAWLLAGYIQFRLLRDRLRRSRLWLIVTAAGGCLASFAGGFAFPHLAAMVQSFVIHGESVPDWLFLYHPAVSVAAAAALGAALVGFLQSLCFDDTFGRRMLWLFASVASGVAAAIFGYISYRTYGQLTVNYLLNSDDIMNSTVWRVVIGGTIGVMCSMILYGLLTGVVLRRLLIRGERRRKEAFIAQFE